jgi:hypothetical protein
MRPRRVHHAEKFNPRQRRLAAAILEKPQFLISRKFFLTDIPESV